MFSAPTKDYKIHIFLSTDHLKKELFTKEYICIITIIPQLVQFPKEKNNYALQSLI